MVEILPSHVREWVNELEREGVGAPTIKYCKVIVDAIFTTALNDQVTFLHPGKGVKTPPVAEEAAAHHHRRAVRCDLRGPG